MYVRLCISVCAYSCVYALVLVCMRVFCLKIIILFKPQEKLVTRVIEIIYYINFLFVSVDTFDVFFLPLMAVIL